MIWRSGSDQLVLIEVWHGHTREFVLPLRTIEKFAYLQHLAASPDYLILQSEEDQPKSIALGSVREWLRSKLSKEPRFRIRSIGEYLKAWAVAPGIAPIDLTGRNTEVQNISYLTSERYKCIGNWKWEGGYLVELSITRDGTVIPVNFLFGKHGDVQEFRTPTEFFLHDPRDGWMTVKDVQPMLDG